MKRIVGWFALYALAVAAFFWWNAGGSVPPELAGTQADPRVYMTEAETENVARYAAWRYTYAFVMPGWQLCVLLLLWRGKLAERIERGLPARIAARRLRLGAALFIVYAAYRLLLVPLQFAFYRVQVSYGLSEQDTASWLGDAAIRLAESAATEFAALLALWWIARRFRRIGAIVAGALAVAVIACYVYLEPIVLDPLYNRFQTLEQGALKTQILQLAEEAGVPAADVYVTDASRQTTAVNGYVKGLGGTSRIVLWDNALTKLRDEEVLALVAHELVHYRDRHVLQGSMLAMAGAFPFCWLLFAAYRRSAGRRPPAEASEPNGFIRFTAIAVVLLFLVQPISNQISVRMETEADRHALLLYPNAEASLGLHQKLAIHNLSNPTPPFVYRLFFGTHPPLVDRMARDLQAGAR